MRIGQRWLAVVLAASIAVLALANTAETARAQTTERCFQETGFCISGRFRTFWEQNGGLSAFGYPLNAQASEQIEGQSRQVQLFERARFELHPENAAPYDVELGRLGDDLLKKQGRDWFTFPKASQSQLDDASCIAFPDTGHTVCGDFLRAYRAYGLSFSSVPGISFEESLALFGKPLSQPMNETTEEGKTYSVQYFERARFEAHPENQPPYNVLFGRLGAILHGGSSTTPSNNLAGTFWQLQSYGPNNTPVSANLSQPATLNFDRDGKINGSSGCNGYGGNYRVNGQQLVFSEVVSTLRACEENGIMQQERALFQALQGTVGYTLANSKLSIAYDNGNQSLVFVPLSISSTSWQLVSYGSVANLSPADSEKPATIAFSGDGQVSGSTGCNSFSGTYTLSGDQLSFSPLAITRAACVGASLQQQERALTQALQGSVRIFYTANGLTISYDGGKQALLLAPA